MSGDAQAGAVDVVAHDGQRVTIEAFVREHYQDIFLSERGKVRLLPKPLGTRDLDAREAAELFAEHFAAIHASLVRFTRVLSPFGWQWYLRRLPDEVFGFGAELSTTAPYDRLLAEIISAHSGRAFEDDPKIVANGRINYRLDKETLRLVLRFCARVALLSDIERQYRCAAKGVRFHVEADYLVPSPSEDLDHAIADFDRRRELEVGDMVAGTRILNIVKDGEHAQRDELLVLCAARLQRLGPVIESPAHAMMPGITLEGASFTPVFASVDHVLELVSATSAYRPVPDEPGLAELLALLSQLAFESVLQDQHHILHSIQRTGYVVRDARMLSAAYSAPLAAQSRSRIAEALCVRLPEESHDLLAVLSRLQGSASPLAFGPVIRPVADGMIAIDVAMATQCLLSGWTREARREQAFKNAVAGSFEALVNESVSRTGKAPDGTLAALVGRTLRLRGERLTDIDAIARVEDEVLLVSCKSIAATAEIRTGLHRQVENTAARLVAAVSDWRAKLRVFAGSPVGDNYDFSGLTIRGVVVTPTLQWAGVGLAQDVAAQRSDGRRLAWVSSAGELERFLER